MSQRARSSRPEVGLWEVETLRLTAFPIPATPLKDPGWWTALMGEPVETKIIQQKLGEQREEGPFLSGTLINLLRPHRIDWLLSPTRDQIGEAMGFETIGSFLELTGPFVELMVRWLDSGMCPVLQRLAFGAILILPVDSRTTGYRKLSPYLPSVTLDPEGSSDFTYQINRPRDSSSGIAGLKVNRLSKWSVASTRLLGFLVEPELSPGVDRGEEYFACRLELDINTAPGRQEPIPQNQLGRVFKELVELGREIVTEGDLP